MSIRKIRGVSELFYRKNVSFLKKKKSKKAYLNFVKKIADEFLKESGIRVFLKENKIKPNKKRWGKMVVESDELTP